MKYLKKALKLFLKEEKRKGLLVFLSIIIMSLLEVVGVGSIAPFVAVLTRPELIETNSYLNRFYVLVGIESYSGFIVFLGICFVAITALISFISFIITYYVKKYSLMMVYSISSRLTEKYLGQPYSFFLNRNTSDFAKNILSETGQVVKGVIQPFFEGLSKALVGIAIIVFLIITDPVLTLLLFVILGVGYGIIFRIIRNKVLKLGKRRVKANQARFKITREAFEGIKETKILGIEDSLGERYKHTTLKFVNSQVKAEIYKILPSYIMRPLIMCVFVVIAIFLMQPSGNIAGSLTVLSVFALGGNRIIPAFQKAFQSVTMIINSLPSLNAVYEDMFQKGIIDPDSTVQNTEQDSVQINFNSQVELNNISFGYNSGKMDITNIFLTIQKNEIIGLVGETGCGKTTLVDLIIGLLSPDQGEILIDGQKLGSDSLQSWYRNFGYIPQNIYLSDDTVKRNIAFGLKEDEIDKEAVENAAKIANIHDFIMNELKENYEAHVGEKGIRLSGGQRQRIGIARALYRNPPIVIMDEATSSLDTLTERAVMDAIDNLMHKKTIILIAHRLNTVKKCDRIYIMDRGKIINSGKYSDLMDNDEYFKSLASG